MSRATTACNDQLGLKVQRPPDHCALPPNLEKRGQKAILERIDSYY